MDLCKPCFTGCVCVCVFFFPSFPKFSQISENKSQDLFLSFSPATTFGGNYSSRCTPSLPPSLQRNASTTGDAADQLARENLKQLDDASGTLGQQLPAFPEVARSLKTQARKAKKEKKNPVKSRYIRTTYSYGRGKDKKKTYTWYIYNIMVLGPGRMLSKRHDKTGKKNEVNLAKRRGEDQVNFIGGITFLGGGRLD